MDRWMDNIIQYFGSGPFACYFNMAVLNITADQVSRDDSGLVFLTMKMVLP